MRPSAVIRQRSGFAAQEEVRLDRLAVGPNPHIVSPSLDKAHDHYVDDHLVHQRLRIVEHLKGGLQIDMLEALNVDLEHRRRCKMCGRDQLR